MTSGRPRTTDYNQILEEVLAGRTAKEISEHLGICASQVHKVAKVFGVSVSLPQRKKNPNEDSIVARVLETGNGYLVDKEFHLSPGSSKRICRMLGVDYQPSIGRKKENLTYEQILEKHPDWKDIEELYLSGKTQAQIGEILRLSQPSIGFVLQKLGIAVGKGVKSRRKKKFLPDGVVQLYESGLSCKEIGLMFGVHR